MSKLKIFSGTANRPLAEGIAEAAGMEIGAAVIKKFSDGEIWVKYPTNIRGDDVFIVQSTQPPADNMMELVILIDAAKRASARRVTAVIPYFGYARQDRKDQPRVSITAKLVANLITAAGADRVITMDLHAPQIQGFFDIPVDHLYSSAIFINYFRKKKIANLAVASPDVGGIKMARSFAKRLEADLGRRQTFRWGPRLIDIDILFYDELVFESEGLVIPHPRLHERAFVLVPLADLAPGLVHPILKKTVADLLADCDAGGVKVYE